MGTTKKKPRLAVGRILWVSFALLLLLFGVFLAGVIVGQQPAYIGRQMQYPDFEAEVLQELFGDARIDGNVIIAHYKEETRQPARAIAPEVGRTVALLLKKGVLVEAAREVPASGLTTPMYVTLLIPYLLLAWFGIAVAGAVASTPDVPLPQPPPEEVPPEELVRSRPLPPTVVEGESKQSASGETAPPSGESYS